METNAKDRLLLFIKYLGMGQNKFEKIVGISNGYFSNIKGSPSLDILTKIIDKYPDLNIEWVMAEKGEMLKPKVLINGDNNTQIEGDKNQVNSNEVLLRAIEEIAEQRKLVAKSQEQIDRLIILLEKK